MKFRTKGFRPVIHTSAQTALLLAERARRLLRDYNLTLDDYDRMVTKQRGCCAICGKIERPNNRNPQGYLLVDHAHHAIGFGVRELLCSPCNTLIGLANEDPAILQAAIDYLHKHKTPWE